MTIIKTIIKNITKLKFLLPVLPFLLLSLWVRSGHPQISVYSVGAVEGHGDDFLKNEQIFYYYFGVINSGNKSFDGSIKISLINKTTGISYGNNVFYLKVYPGRFEYIYIDYTKKITPLKNDYDIAVFEYKIISRDNKIIKEGKGEITPNYPYERRTAGPLTGLFGRTVNVHAQ